MSVDLILREEKYTFIDPRLSSPSAPICFKDSKIRFLLSSYFLWGILNHVFTSVFLSTLYWIEVKADRSLIYIYIWRSCKWGVPINAGLDSRCVHILIELKCVFTARLCFQFFLVFSVFQVWLILILSKFFIQAYSYICLTWLPLLRKYYHKSILIYVHSLEAVHDWGSWSLFRENPVWSRQGAGENSLKLNF